MDVLIIAILVVVVIILIVLLGISSFLLRLGAVIRKMQELPLAPVQRETALVDVEETLHKLV